MAWSLISNTSKKSTNGNGFTTAAISTLTADFIAIIVVSYLPIGAPALSDSAGNAWTGLTLQSNAVTRTQLFYKFSPTTSGTHTFTLSGNFSFSSIYVQAWKGSLSYESQNGASGNSPLATGSVTPSVNGDLVIAGGGTDGSSQTWTINAGFTITDQLTRDGNAEGGAMAYLVQGTAAAVNPTWTTTTTVAVLAVIACFKGLSGGLKRNTSMNGLGASGGFFHDPLSAAPKFVRRDRLFMPPHVARGEMLERSA